MSRVYFTDRDLGKQFPRILADAGIVVERHGDLFQLAHNFVQTLQRIEDFLDHHSPPFIAKVYRPTPAEVVKSSTAAGRVEIWFPKY